MSATQSLSKSTRYRKQSHSRIFSRRRRPMLEFLEDRIALAYTATTTGAFVGDSAGDTITFSQVGGLLTHNRAGDGGFVSQFDFDSDTSGEQVLAASASTAISVNTGGGNDTVNIGTATVAASTLFATFSITNTGQDGDTLVVDDSASATGATYTETSVQITAPGIIVNRSGAGYSGGVELRTSSGSDTVNLRSVASGTFVEPVRFATGGGDDTINIDPLGAASDSLDSFLQTITVNAGAGTNDSLFINDDDDTDANTYTITDTSVQRTPAVINYDANLENLRLDAGTNVDTININSLPSAATGTSALVNAGAGGDFILVRATPAGATTTLNGDSGNDVFLFDSNGFTAGGTLNGILGPVTINGGDNDALSTVSITTGCGVTTTLAQGDRVLFIDTDNPAGQSSVYSLSDTLFQRISNSPGGTATGLVSFATVERIDLLTGAGIDDILVSTTRDETTLIVSPGGGDDTVTVQNTGSGPAGAGSIVFVNSEGGADTIEVQATGANSAVLASGGTEDDVITFGNTGAESRVTLTGGNGADTLNVRGTGANSRTEVNGEGGNDTINFGSAGNSLDTIQGHVCVSGGANDPTPTVTQTVTGGVTVSTTLPVGDTLNLNDQGDGDGNTHRLNGSRLERNGVTNIFFGPPEETLTIESINLNAGPASDNIILETTPDATTVTVNAGEGGDFVTVQSTGAGPAGSASLTVINGQADSDVIDVTTTGANSVTIVNGGDEAVAGDTIRLAGNGAGSGVELNGQGGDDQINVRATTGGTATDVNGGSGADNISLADAANLFGGIVDGGEGVDTLDYSDFTTAVAVNLGSNVSSLVATLQGDQEVPPTPSNATGTATITDYNMVNHTIDITVTVSGLSPGLVNGFHIHRAPLGVNGPIIVDFGTGGLVSDGMGGFTFTANDVPIDPMHEAALLGGITYVNVHTTAFPGGEIRGQVFPAALFVAAAGTATNTGGVTNIENATGGAGSFSVGPATFGDSIVGSIGGNILRGGPSNDVLVGSRSNDTMEGDAGNDIMVWSNGDGTDVMNGGADNDLANVNGNPTADDVFAIGTGPAGRVDFDRLSPGPFSLDIGTAETLSVIGIAGSDTFTVNSLAGVVDLTAINLNGLDGNDTFNVTPATNVTINVAGHQPRTAPGDTLNYSGSGTVNPSGPGAGSITQNGVQNVNFTGIEDVNTTITVSVQNGQLKVEGSSDDDIVTITGIPAGVPGTGMYEVTTQQGSQLPQTQTVTGVTGDIRVNLRAGNDQLTMNNAFVNGAIVIEMESGNDTVTLGNLDVVSTAQDLAVNLGAGNDVLDGKRIFIGRDQLLVGGDGDDSFTFDGIESPFTLGTSAAGNANWLTGEGDDTVHVVYAFIVGAFAIDLGGGTDSLDIFGSAVSGNVVFLGGVGSDSLTVDTNFFDAAVFLDTGADNDTIFLANGLGTDISTINTGAGDDEVTVQNETAGRSNIDTGSGDDIVDVRSSAVDQFFALLGDDDDELTLFGNLVQIEADLDGGAGSADRLIDLGNDVRGELRTRNFELFG
jgi:hypothetical protein